MRKIWKHIVSGIAIVLLCGQLSIQVMAEEDTLPIDAGRMSGYVDLSESIFQAGGYMEPNMNYAASTYAVTEREQLKGEIYQALKNERSYYTVYYYGFTVDDMEELINLYIEVLNEHPELFYVEPYFRYSYYESGEVTYLWFYYSGATEEERQLFSEAVDAALEWIDEDMTDVEKALVLHDYLAQNCTYAYDDFLQGTLDDNVFSSYGALVDKLAVCNGYASAYSTLLREVGINSFLCTSDVMDHAWNYIFLDGEWYHVDVTWDDPVWNKEGLVLHEFFLLSDAEMMNREHYGWSEIVECTSQKYDGADYWWRKIDSLIYIEDDKAYYIEDNNNGIGFQLKEKDGNNTNAKYSNNSYWPVWNSFGGAWVGAFSYLSVQEDYMYFNDNQNLYAMHVNSNVPQMIYTYNGSDGYIYGAMVYEDGTARLNICKSPNDETDDYIVIDLKAAKPVLEVDYDAKTISTTAAMVYSTDGGNTWKACAANMGLTEFGWTETKNKTVLFKVPAAGGLFESEVTEVTIKALPGTITGNIKCLGDNNSITTIQLIDANGTVSASVTVGGDSTEYALGSVNAGTYIMNVSKKNYVTREYVVEIGHEALTLDVEIHLIGDINGDGIINAMDKKRMFNHILQTSILENYDFAVGDLNSDGSITAKDKKILFNHIAGISNLWE